MWLKEKKTGIMNYGDWSLHKMSSAYFQHNMTSLMNLFRRTPVFVRVYDKKFYKNSPYISINSWLQCRLKDTTICIRYSSMWLVVLSTQLTADVTAFVWSYEITYHSFSWQCHHKQLLKIIISAISTKFKPVITYSQTILMRLCKLWKPLTWFDSICYRAILSNMYLVCPMKDVLALHSLWSFCHWADESSVQIAYSGKKHNGNEIEICLCN